MKKIAEYFRDSFLIIKDFKNFEDFKKYLEDKNFYIETSEDSDDFNVRTCLIELKNEIEKLPFKERDSSIKSFHKELIVYIIDNQIKDNDKGILKWHSAGSIIEERHEILIFEKNDKASIYENVGLRYKKIGEIDGYKFNKPSLLKEEIDYILENY